MDGLLIVYARPAILCGGGTAFGPRSTNTASCKVRATRFFGMAADAPLHIRTISMRAQSYPENAVSTTR